MSDKRNQHHTGQQKAVRTVGGVETVRADPPAAQMNGWSVNGADHGHGPDAAAQGAPGFVRAQAAPPGLSPSSVQQEAVARVGHALASVLSEIDLERDEAMYAPFDGRIALILDVPRAELLSRASERLQCSRGELILMALDRLLDNEV